MLERAKVYAKNRTRRRNHRYELLAGKTIISVEPPSVAPSWNALADPLVDIVRSTEKLHGWAIRWTR
jgi:hypothetical protein